jgi:uncharacterized protein with ParB-like and HNH nuclease domain
MKAEAMSFTFLGNEGMVKIPFFQRGYVWDKENWGELLNDLLNETKSHFLGSLILKQQEKQSGKPKEVLVIDGQQRLTTLSILIKALYDTFSNETKKNCENAIYTYLFYKKNQTDSEYCIKIQHSHIDTNYYQKVIESKIDELTFQSINDSSNKILQCYKYFVEELENKSEHEKKSLFNRILDTENKILVIIDLSEKEDEQAIFDTINSSGVRLSGADIVKNALFQKAIELFDNQDEAITLYKNNWEKIFIVDEETIRFWDTQRSTGRLKRDNIEILLHSIAVIEGFFDPDINTLSELPSLYKKRISILNDKGQLIKFIEEIKDYAELYRDKILSFDKSTLFSFSDGIQRIFHILEVLEISTFHPYILFLLKKYKNDENMLSNNLLKLEKFIVRRMVSNQETKSYNKICKEFIVDENLINEKINEVDDNQISLGLQSIPNKNAALLLFWVELYRRHKDNKFDVKELQYNYSLEHIMPQKWEEYWTNIPEKKNTNGSIMADEEAKKDRYNKIYWIGNMTLLTTSLNSSLRNYVYEKKINGDGRKKGMKAYAALSITRDDIISKFENGDLVWDEDRIIKRTNDLTSEIKQIW